MFLRQPEQGKNQQKSAVYKQINEHFELVFNDVMAT